MADEICTRCGTRNDDGAKFCEGCGASLGAQVQCPSCNALNPLGRKFCTSCGGSLEHAGWGEPLAPGAVVEGEWQRGEGELLRRVDPDEARRFLGTRTVRVPVGTVGVVLVDGVVDRVLPPGERTSVSLFERLRGFFSGRERTAFYLVDQRPFPVPFVVRTRPSSGGEVVKTQVMVTFQLPKGDRDALAMFIETVLRGRTSVSTGELYNEVRPEVARTAQEALERAAAGADIDYAAVEGEIRQKLAEGFARRYGLTVDATLAPLTAVASLNLMLGAGEAPTTRACAKCRAELPMSMRFCDRCGERQPTAPAGATEHTAESPLFTADGQQVELDVVVRAQGQHDDFTPAKIAPAVVAAAAQYLRGVAFAKLVEPGGFAALERAVAPAVNAALAALGMTLVAFAAVDARSKTGQWTLSARADLERAAAEVRLGLDWLEQRDAELDLEQLVIARVLREQQQRRDQKLAEATAAIEDREQREGLAARGAVMDVAQIRRDATVAATRDAADVARRRTALDAELAELRARHDLDFTELERRKRLELELAAIAEQQQVEKLRAMAQIDRETSAQDQAQVIERRAQLAGLTPEQMIAMQAGELAKSEGGGAAWAQTLSAHAQDEARHAAEDRALYEKSMAAMAQVASSRAAAAPVVGAPVVNVASGASPRACPSCGVALRPDAKFCNACGAATP